MTEREKFVLRALDIGPEMTFAKLCTEFGISRKTGYKWLSRYKQGGFQALENMSRRPATSPLQVSADMALEVVKLRRERPRWGPKKLHAVLSKRNDLGDVPSVRTIDRILNRAGEPRKRKRKRKISVASSCPEVEVNGPNDLWTVDFKGWWLAGDQTRCEPLTVRDQWSRFVLAVELTSSTSAAAVQPVFERLFRLHGLPRTIQSDNGSPFGSTRSRAGLTRLSAWWTSLGIDVVFSRPGKPQDNGGHERMHLDVRYELEDYAADDRDAQARACARWRHDFNHHRPHESLGQDVPADRYESSPRHLRNGCRHFVYPSTWMTRKVSHGGISIASKMYRIGKAFCGYHVGLEPIDEHVMRVWLFDRDLGTLDLRCFSRDARHVTPDWVGIHAAK